MVWKDRVYFASDRDGTMNLWVMDAGDTADEKVAAPIQLTRHRGFDVLRPSLSQGRIVYQRGADLRVYDIAGETDKKIAITLPSDFDQTREKWIEKPLEYLTALDISPDGDRVAVTTRGNVFLLPTKAGRRVDLTRSRGTRFRGARFLPDGKSLVALSDATGEFEFYSLPANGLDQPKQLSSDGKVFRYFPVPSPDGKFVAYRDKNYELFLLDVARGKSRRIARSDNYNFSWLSWSPDSRWLAFVVAAENSNDQIHLYNVEKKSDTAVTTDRYDSYAPSWSSDGRFLYFLSDRNFESLVASPWGPRQPEPFFDRTTQVFELSLRKKQRSVFQSTDELVDGGGKKKPMADGDQKAASIDLDGITTRLAVVPVLSVDHINVLLRNTSGRKVLCSVRDAGEMESRRVIVEPISSTRATDLRYDQWEYTRRKAVETLGKGKVGYVHLRAMGKSNIAEWARHYYPVFHRQGLIIDVRHNRGGNIDSWILEKLLRKAWFYWKPRVGKPYWNMQYAFRGHMVVLCNEKTASDGEAFAEGFRRLGMGSLIGTRAWGGEIWLSINNRLVDRGFASAAQTGVYGPERKWLIEGHGVDPDVVVDNLPHATFGGGDAQLDAAVKHLLQKIKKDPRPVPKPPKYRKR
tara:strand:+ start:379 stop:2280 length:1902 start_codon:yes stop_codon:yes gene_type:complete